MMTIATVIRTARGLLIRAYDSFILHITALLQTEAPVTWEIPLSDTLPIEITQAVSLSIENTSEASISSIYEAQITNEYPKSISDEIAPNIVSEKCVDIIQARDILATNMKSLDIAHNVVATVATVIETEIANILGGIIVVADIIIDYFNNAVIMVFDSFGIPRLSYISITDQTTTILVHCEDK